MKKSFKLENLDCANCAAKMENGICKISGVQNAKISFMTQRLTIIADEEEMDRILNEASQIVKKVNSDCKIVVK